MVQILLNCWLWVREYLRQRSCCQRTTTMFTLKKAMSDEELVGGGTDNHNWRGIVISLLVIMLIVSLIVIAVFIVMPEDEYLPKEFLFDDIFNETLKPNHHELQWISGSKYVYRDQYKNIVSKDLEMDESDILITNRTLDSQDASKFWANSDMTFILLACNVKGLYRHSFYAKYKIFHVHSKSLFGLTAPGFKDMVDLRYAGWGPTGSALAFVYKNDLYYMDSVPSKRKSNLPVGDTAQRVTHTGEEGVIFNGIPDWVYEEELLASNSALYWSADGSHLIYGSFNDSGVAKVWYPKYQNLLYCEVEEFAYPKAGFPNPTFTLQVVNTSELGNPVTLVPPEDISKKDYYYQHVLWIDNDQVAVVWLNRPQNISILTLCQVRTGECIKNHDLRTPDGWVVDRGPPIFSEGSSQLDYVRVLPQRESTFGKYFHVALIPADKSLSKETFLTQGRWEVTAILAYKKSDKLVYFMSTEKSLRGRHLYSVSTEEPHARKCLSCNVKDNEDCTYYSAVFSPDASWYKLNCLGFGIPRTTIHKTGTDKFLIAETNEALAKALEGKSFPNKTFIELEVGEYTIPIQMWLPQRMDPKRKHPILVHTYGGPGSQMVNDRFELGWNAYLSSKYYVIVVNIDGRGSGFQGQKHLYQIYRKFGTVEVQDQVIAVRHILNEIEYVNTTKVGIWGWSYGGFVASMALSSDDEIFKYGLAVAPVSDFRYYDSIYTERYMGLPIAMDNLEGYKHTNLSARAKNIKGLNYFLIHGTADNNVHFQNSADLVRSLVQEEVTHRTQFYPDQKHSLDDRHVLRHLYDSMSEFVHSSIQKNYKSEL